MAINGVDILLFVNTGTPGSPVWEAATGQRGATFDETTDEIDASSKDARAKRVLAGRYGSTISMDAPDNDVSTCSISLTIDGEWTPVGT